MTVKTIAVTTTLTETAAVVDTVSERTVGGGGGQIIIYESHHAASYLCIYVQLHSNRAGSGSQRPELLQVAVFAPTSENPGSHWKVMTEPSIGLVF